MSSRLQNLYNKYNVRKIEIENNEKIIKDEISTIKAIKESLSPEVIEIINGYHPNLLDMLNVERFSDLSKIDEFKENLNFVIETLFTSMESDLV